MSTVTIKHEATSLYVEIQVDTSTYLLSQEQYAELWHTALQHPPADVLWASYVTKEFIDPAHAEQAVDELNDFVANTCMEYAPEGKACNNCGDETEDFLTNYADSDDDEELWLCDICAKEDN